MYRAEVEAPADLFLKLLAVVSDPRACPPERERRPDDERKSQLLGRLKGRLDRRHDHAVRNVQPNSLHGVFEPQPVFGHLDGLERGADELDAMLSEDAFLGELHREVQRCLAAHGREHGIRPLARNDGLQVLRRQRLDVSAVGKFRVSHDGGGVGIHQHYFVAFRAQRFAGLCARIVELARLANDDRPRADD